MKNPRTRLLIIPLCIFIFTPLGYLIAQINASAKTAIIFSNKEFKQVLTEAKANHKKIFIDAYATWCAPCKELQKTTFREAKTASYFNKNFINVSIEMEKEDGITLAKIWKIEGLPTLIILDENGNILANHVGYLNGSSLLKFAKGVSSD